MSLWNQFGRVAAYYPVHIGVCSALCRVSLTLLLCTVHYTHTHTHKHTNKDWIICSHTTELVR